MKSLNPHDPVKNVNMIIVYCNCDSMIHSHRIRVFHVIFILFFYYR